jgi:P-type E1-E2 ATPase
MGFLIFASMCAFLVIKIMFSSTTLLSNDTLVSILDFFTISVAIVIVAVPEGLPLSISIAMAFSIDTLKEDNLLIKKLSAIEGMGQVTEICTGKTATLTKNDMNVTRIYTSQQFIINRDPATFTHCDLRM